MINNAFYDELGDGWLLRSDHPIALLRAENNVRIPWIEKRLAESTKLLDIGCGAGLLANRLALRGHQVVGVDLSETTLEVARRTDATQSVKYIQANAYSLPFETDSFDAVCAMDVLEHVEAPECLLAEAARVLRPGGTFFFHTFNRNWLSYLVVIKGVEWCVKNAPRNMHVYPLFIKPQELEDRCADYKLNVVELRGFAPKLLTRAFWKMVWKREVPQGFTFKFTRSLATGYCGIATKE